MICLEALCLDPECSEVYIAADENDLEHIERADGTTCGGRGVIIAEVG
jgi:hypothetical protein